MEPNSTKKPTPLKEFELPEFEILDEINRGSSSIVFRGIHKVLQRDVAIKVLKHDTLDERSLNRFQKETAILHSLQHANIVQIFAAGITTTRRPYIVMELVDGVALDTLIKQQKISLPEIKEIFSQILKGLQFAHSQNIVHRDITPGNILITKASTGSLSAKLVDFGLAKMLTEQGQVVQNLTASGVVTGTALYMSPEQCCGREVTPQSDIYSLGCVLYQVFAGSPPFSGQSCYDVMYKHVNEKCDPIRANSTGEKKLARLITRSIEKDPNNRFASAKEMFDCLMEIEHDDSSGTKRINLGMVAAFLLVVAMPIIYTNLLAKSTQEKEPPYVTKATSQTIPGLYHAAQTAEEMLAHKRPRAARDMLLLSIAKYERATASMRFNAHILLARAYCGSFQWEESKREISICRNMVAKEPELAEMKTGLMADIFTWESLVLRDLGQYDESIKAMEIARTKLEELGRTDILSGLNCRLAYVWADKGIPETALKLLEESLSQTPKAADRYAYMADLYAALGKNALADKNLKEAICSKNLDEFLLQGVILATFNLGRFIDCKDFLERELRALEKYESEPESVLLAQSRLALVYNLMKKSNECNLALKDAMKTATVVNGPPLWFFDIAAAEIMLSRGQVARAVEYLKKADCVPIHGLYARIRYRYYWLKGRAALIQSKKSQARTYFEKALKLWKNYAPMNKDYQDCLQQLNALKTQT